MKQKAANVEVLHRPPTQIKVSPELDEQPQKVQDLSKKVRTLTRLKLK